MSRPGARAIPWRGYAWCAGILVLCAGFLGWTAYTGIWPTLVLAGLAVLSIGIMLLMHVMGWGAGVGAAVVVGLVLAGAALAVQRTPLGALESDVDRPLWRELLDSVPRLLTTPPGTPARLDLLAPSALLVAIVVVGAALRLRRRTPAMPPLGISTLIASLVLYGSAMLLTAGQADRYGLFAALLLALNIAPWTRFGLRTWAALLAAGAVASGVAVIPFGPGRDIRDSIEPPTIPVSQPSLMPYMAIWTDETDLPLFTLQGTLPSRVALASYPRYDGVSWGSGSAFATPGTTSPPALPDPPNAVRYQMSVVAGDLPTRWVPSAGTVTKVSGAEIAHDVLGGGLIRLAPDGEISYSLAGNVGIGGPITPTTGVPDAASAQGFLDVPPLPADLAAWVQPLLSYGSRYERAAGLETLLREGRAYEPTATGGSSIGDIARLVLAPVEDGGAVGTQEQFASAFAVLARYMGIPSRVVIGAVLDDAPGTATSTNMQVDSGDISVWPEAYFTGVGWVAFSPTPTGNPTPTQQQNAEIKASAENEAKAESGGNTPNGGSNAGNRKKDPAAVRDREAARKRATAYIIGGTGGAAVLLLGGSALAGLLVQRVLRRRGARGSWASIERGAVLAGAPPSTSTTAESMVEDIRRLTNSQAADRAAVVADAAQRAAYSPEQHDEDAAWADASTVRKELRRSMPLIKRMWWPFDPKGWRRR